MNRDAHLCLSVQNFKKWNVSSNQIANEWWHCISLRWLTQQGFNSKLRILVDEKLYLISHLNPVLLVVVSFRTSNQLLSLGPLPEPNKVNSCFGFLLQEWEQDGPSLWLETLLYHAVLKLREFEDKCGRTKAHWGKEKELACLILYLTNVGALYCIYERIRIKPQCCHSISQPEMFIPTTAV